jgi:hypothetical protein
MTDDWPAHLRAVWHVLIPKTDHAGQKLNNPVISATPPTIYATIAIVPVTT